MSTLKRDKKSLLITNPDLAKEWDYVKNAPLTPEDFTNGSSEKVWWICASNHEWEARIDSRSIQKSGCPYYNNKRVLAGFNDLYYR